MPPFTLSTPLTGSDKPLSIDLNPGECLFVLGANGTGKSSLMQRFFQFHHTSGRRISAHRQTWFESNAINMTGAKRRDSETNRRDFDNQPNSRFTDNAPAMRASLAIYDLVDAENVQAREIADAARKENDKLVKELIKKDAPVTIINELLKLSNLPIEISVKANEQIFASKSGGTPYSIAELSDGERNALLIAAEVLTVKPETLVIIDEPERHLHRSIISPLLTHLFSKRPDCAFVVSTHDVSLPLDNPKSRTLLIRSCTYTDSVVTSWDADLVDAGGDIDEELKKDILGARRKLLFVEGTDSSLDKPLYSLIFPNVSVVAKGGCREVERAVVGIRGATDLAWVHAYGLVDNDRRPTDEIKALQANGVYALPVFSVEAVYYHPEIQIRLAEKQATTNKADPKKYLDAAHAAALAAITPHIPRLSVRIAEKSVREELFRHLPKKGEVAKKTPIDAKIDVAKFVDDELASLQVLHKAGDLLAIISRYPVRETSALDEIATKLSFKNRNEYEDATRKMLMEDATALNFVRELFGTMYADINAA